MPKALLDGLQLTLCWVAEPLRSLCGSAHMPGADWGNIVNMQGAAPGSRPRENGDATQADGSISEMDRRQRELYAKQQQLLREQRSQDQEKLLACISGARPPRLPLPAQLV